VDEILWMGLSADILIAMSASTVVEGLAHLLINARNWRKDPE